MIGKTDPRRDVNHLITSGQYDPTSEIPAALINLSVVEEIAHMWKKELPQVRPYYAMKSGPDLKTMETLHALGFGFDCASDVEIEIARQIPSLDCTKDVIFAHPSKFVSHIKRAKEWGVIMTTFDNIDELGKLNQHYPEAELLLRIRPPSGKALFELGKKFGALEQNWLEMFNFIKDKGLVLKGIAFHVGSLCNEPETFEKAIGMARSCFDTAYSVGLKPDLLDIGGGYGNHPEWNLPPFSEFARVIREGLKQHFGDLSHIRFIAEPGRLILETATILVASVIGKRVDQVIDETSGETHPHYNYFLNDGVYGSLYGLPYGEYLRNEGNTIPLQDNPTAKLLPTSLFGPTCDCTDTLTDNIRLPELHMGDKILMNFLGAYLLRLALGGVSENTTFNGYPRPQVYHYRLAPPKSD